MIYPRRSEKKENSAAHPKRQKKAGYNDILKYIKRQIINKQPNI